MAEWFLVTQITETPELARGMANVGPAQKAALLVLLAHASDHMPDAADLFAEFIATDITGLAAAAADAALTAHAGQPRLDAALAPALAPLISQASWTAEALAALHGQLPRSLLPGARAAVATALVENLRETGTPEDLAAALQSHGADLGQLGRHPEALAATQEAVRLWRKLTGRSLATQLMGDLTELALHQQGEVRATTDEALGLLRTLADGDPARQPDLARALNDLGVHTWRG